MSVKLDKSEIDFIMSRLKNDKKKNNVPAKIVPPKRIMSPEIAKLSGQINDKLNPTMFTKEAHLSKTDPGYGTPQAGTLTEARGKRAHRDICVEVVDMCQVIWDHAIRSGNYDCDDDNDIACILFQDLFTMYSKISGNVS